MTAITDDFGFVSRYDTEREKDEFGFQPRNPTKSPEEKKESIFSQIFRTAYQIPSGRAKAITYPLDIWQTMGYAALDPEEIDQIRKISEREGIPFDEENYKEQALNAIQSFPTQSNIERFVEEETGLPLTPKTEIQKLINLGSTAGKFAPGRTLQKGTATVVAPIAAKGLEELGVPEPLAEMLGLGISQPTSLLAPKGALEIGKKTKPSGLPERRYEALEKPKEVSESRLTKINQKVESDFKDLSDKIIAESPVGETAKKLRSDPTYKQESRELLNQAQEIANELPGNIDKTLLKKEIADISAKSKKGYLNSEYDKEYSKFINEIIKEVPEGEIRPGQSVEQFRKNNSELSEYFEPGRSKAFNRAKRDALLDHNRAIASVMEKQFPESELVPIFKEGNERWTKIKNVEAIDEFIEDFTKGKIDYKRGRDFFDDPNTERIFKKALGDKYLQFEKLMKDMMSSEKGYKMLKKAKDIGMNDLWKTGMSFIIHPKLGALKGAYTIGKMAWKSALNAMLDKPKIGITWKKGYDALKKGDFKQAKNTFKTLEGEILEAEKPLSKPIQETELEAEVTPIESKKIEHQPKLLEHKKEPKIEARKEALKKFKESKPKTEEKKPEKIKKPIIGNKNQAVSWFLHENSKRPFGYTTQATSDYIEILAEDSKTYSDLYSKIKYDPDAKKIIGRFIEEGYGNEKIELTKWGGIKPLKEKKKSKK